MSNTVKGIRKVIRYAGIDVEAFQLPDGSYRVGQSSATALIEKERKSFTEFLRTDVAQTLAVQRSDRGGFLSKAKLKTVEAIELSLDKENRASFDFSVVPILYSDSFSKPANGQTLECVMAYWKYWALKGDENAINLLVAGAIQDFERAIEKAFGVSRTEEQYEERRVEKLKDIRQIVWNRLKEETGYEVNGFQIDEPDTPVPGNHPKFKKIEYHRVEDVLWYFNPRTDTFSVAASTPNRKDYDLWEAFCGFYETFGTLESNMRVLKGLRAAASELAPHLIR